jgi:dTDP-4-dehydrorhamnose reductase
VVEATEVTVTWLLLGANGQLGRSLQDVLLASGIEFVAAGRADTDITDIASVDSCVKQTTPSVIVNMAAWTDVDGAESHQDEAFLVNATGAENVAKIAAKYEIPLVHISTDYVFDGTQTTPYRTDDATNPLSVYGTTKLQGELLVQAAHPDCSWIVRTAWLYSQYGKNFARTIARKGLAGDNLSVVNDSYGQPTSALAVARQIVALVTTHPPAGIFHATNAGSATWHEFASAIVDPIANHGSVTPVSSTSFPTVAVRPKYSVLDHTGWSACGISDMPHWRDSLEEIHSAVLDSINGEKK